MMYSEFLEGTGCKQTEKNYEIFRGLEIIYMNTDCTKEHIYKIGKKLVDNSKSTEDIAIEERIKKLIKDAIGQVEWTEEEIEMNKSFLKDTFCTEEEERDIKNYISELYKYKRKKKIYIAELRWALKG